jgi:type II secretory ATPase GspE/PulE/Tfp pilus assembly ATPase PilB-like protein
MTNRTLKLTFLLIGVLAVLDLTALNLFAQMPMPTPPSVDLNELMHRFYRGPGFYHAWYKLLLIIVVFWFWVKTTDWISRDCEMVHETTGMHGYLWNSITVASLMFGMLAVLFIPFFILGYPIYLLAMIVPFVVYTLMRNSHFEGADRVFSAAHRKRLKKLKALPEGAELEEELAPLAQDAGPAIQFKASGKDSTEQKHNLIKVRQNPLFIFLKEMLADAAFKRAQTVRMDYTRDAVAVRYQIDGLWHQMPPLDRQTGDILLEAYKNLAALNPADRRNKQAGKFEYKLPDRPMICDLRTQGTQTGEVALLTLEDKKAKSYTMLELGMTEEMLTTFKKYLGTTGYPIISAMPGDGLSTTWKSSLETMDRVTREIIGLVEKGNPERHIENIEFHELPPGVNVQEFLRPLLLKQPEAFAVPHPISGELIDILTKQINNPTEPKFAISHVRARSATEALLRMLAFKCDRTEFAKAVTMVLCQRLVRRLCEACRQPYQAPPGLLQKLGVNPQQQVTLFREYQPPPPEELVDEKGNPIAPPICPECAGFGYKGRIAIFELLEINDLIRQTLIKQPKLEALDAAAKKSKHLGIQERGIQMVLAGVTSLTELQRVLKSK